LPDGKGAAENGVLIVYFKNILRRHRGGGDGKVPKKIGGVLLGTTIDQGGKIRGD